MNIEPLCKLAMGFLKENVHMPSLGTVTNIGEITEIEWYERAGRTRAGSIFITNEEPRIVGFKRVTQQCHIKS